MTLVEERNKKTGKPYFEQVTRDLQQTCKECGPNIHSYLPVKNNIKYERSNINL